MTDEEIVSFLAVVKTGSLSAAAELLYVTHPALTHRIKSLEKNLGYQLFTRGPGVRKTTLTPSGKQFFSLAEQLNHLSQDAHALKEVDAPVRFGIAAIESVSALIMAPICQHLTSEFQNLRLSIKIQYSINTYSDMLNHTIDFGIVNNTQYAKELRCQPAFREKMVFVCRAGADYPAVVDPTMLNGKDSVFVPWFEGFEAWYQYWFHGVDEYGLFLQNTHILRACLNTPKSWSIVPALVGNWLVSFPDFELHDIHNGPIDRMNYFLTPMDGGSEFVARAKELIYAELYGQRGIDVLFQPETDKEITPVNE